MARLNSGEIAVSGVFDKQTLIAAVVCFAHRGLYADLGGNARDQQMRDAAAACEFVPKQLVPEHEPLPGLRMTNSLGIG